MNKMYASKERVYVNSAGDVCAEDDPDVAVMKYAVGAPVPREEAIRQGIIPADTKEASGAAAPADLEPTTAETKKPAARKKKTTTAAARKKAAQQTPKED